MYFLASRHTLKAFLKLSIWPAEAWAAAWPCLLDLGGGLFLLPAPLGPARDQADARADGRALAGVVAGDLADQRAGGRAAQRALGAGALAGLLGLLLLLGRLLLLLFLPASRPANGSLPVFWTAQL